MAFIRNPALAYETRVTLIRLGFYIDIFPRVCFALLLPVGLQLARNLALYPIGTRPAGRRLGTRARLGVAPHHRGRPQGHAPGQAPSGRQQMVRSAGRGGLRRHRRAVAGHGPPIEAGWFALKLLLFGLIFWVILGIDTHFQPFTTLLAMGPAGSTPEREAVILRMTNQTMAWALLLYGVIAGVAFLGRVKPFW